MLDACRLWPDIAMLPALDRTVVGERGVTLSGGQKSRVALARAVYARPAAILLDDPLSALDAETGRAIFAALLGGDSPLSETASAPTGSRSRWHASLPKREPSHPYSIRHLLTLRLTKAVWVGITPAWQEGAVFRVRRDPGDARRPVFECSDQRAGAARLARGLPRLAPPGMDIHREDRIAVYVSAGLSLSSCHVYAATSTH